jgi:hypothetical protein
MFLPPTAWFLSQQISYALIPWACATGRQFALPIVILAMWLVAVAGGVIAWRRWRLTGRNSESSAGGPPRSRFIALVGMLSSGLFAMAIRAQVIPSVILSACEP